MINKDAFLFEAIRNFCSSLDISVSLHRLICFLSRSIPLDNIQLVIYEPELKAVREIAQATLEKGEWLNHLFPLSKKEYRYAEKLNMKKPRIVKDLFYLEQQGTLIKNKLQRTFGVSADNVSSMTLPLTIERKWIGNLNLYVKGREKYHSAHIDLLISLQEPFAMVLENALQHKELLRLQKVLNDHNRFLQQELRITSENEIIGKKFGLKHVMEMVRQVAPLDNPILLLGETGTGKEVIANAIHSASPRKNEPFIKVNCGAIPANLIESELFGHEKGAFTGAVGQRRGRFEQANKGSIFLDEIGELSLQAQVSLLRVIQQKEIDRVGGTSPIRLNIRIIAATNRNLENMVQENQFREDLWFRLNVFPIVIPPLRQRTMDIPELVNYFIKNKAKEMKLSIVPKLASGSINKLIGYEWKGNVRELENVIERAIIRSQDGILIPEDYLLPLDPYPMEVQSVKKRGRIPTIDEITKNHIEKVLQICNGKVSGTGGAAETLKIHTNTLRSKMKKLRIRFKNEK